MKLYRVGGAIRDEILGLPRGDDDFVVVGATEEEFLSRFPGAQRVGKAFPVYLVAGAEYAFARRERKTGPGYRGFETVADPSVTLVEDLKRRDLTINAIAQDTETRELIDPWGGRNDIAEKRLRHISDAFAEDPLRLYRVARFAALLPDFTLEPATIELMKKLTPELDTLSPERVWRECERALATRAPWRFFELLRDTGALPVHFPELHALVGVTPGKGKCHAGETDTFDHTLHLLRRLPGADPYLRFAALCHDLGKGLTDPALLPKHHGHDKAGLPLVGTLCDRLKSPNRFRLAGELAARYHMNGADLPELRAGKAVTLLRKLRRFPGGGIAGYLALLHADAAGREPDLTPFAPEFERILDIPLPEKDRDRGPKSGEILINLQAEAFNELREKMGGS